MKIVVLADNRKNELLVNFCIAYKQILGRHEIMSISNNVRLLEQATGLRISGIATDVSGGMNQLAARAEFNEIDAVIFLRDPQQGNYEGPNLLMRSCDQNNIPYASNLASAELLVLAIDRGDLDWRELVH